jgi:tyrosine-protein kinase Etk/Wzc
MQENNTNTGYNPNAKNGFEEEGNVLNELLFKYIPYWPLLLILLAISLSVAFLYLHYTVPVYQSSATILIKDEKNGLDESKLLESFNMLGGKKIVENEIEVIHSRTMAKDVAKTLHLYSHVMFKGRVSDRSAYLSSPVQIEVASPDSIELTKKVFFSCNSRQVVINKKAYALDEWVNTPYGVLKFITNKEYKSPTDTKPLYFSLIPLKQVAEDLLTNLQVTATSKTSTVINLVFKDEVPQRGEDILNQWISAYNKAAINDKNQLAGNTLNFVEDRLKYVVRELDSVESQLQNYKTRNNIVDISEQGKQFLENVGDNDKRLGEFNIQLAALDEVEKYVSSKSDKGPIVPAAFGIDNPVLNKLLQNLYDAQTQYERLRNTTGENDPVMIAVVDQVSKVKPAILENIQNQRQALEAGRGNIYSTNNKYASILQTIPTKERELLEISRQQSIKNGIYTFLLQKREETALSYASTVADSRLLDAADTDLKPVSPRVSMAYLIAIIAAFGGLIGFVTIKEMLSRNILFRSEIEKYTSIPILGEVMYDGSNKEIVIGEGKRTFVAEQIRQIRTSLGYLGLNSRKKKILVTSTISGEGKSFITSNLAVSLALVGKKVVMIELDLRKPRLSKAFGISRNIGITNYLVSDKEPEEIIKKVEQHPNLFIIPAGPTPPNPSELILNGRLPQLLTYLEDHFDYILIDTSPISPVTDGYIISPMCDATLYVVRHGYTPRIYIQRLQEQMRIRELKNMAIIFNGVKQRGFSYGSGYGYGYGYGYGEDYGEKEAKKKGLFKRKKANLEI